VPENTSVEANVSQKPDFIGIGAPKCATTWLFHQMAAVPGIHVPLQKETHFFTDNRFIAKNLDEYQRLFEQSCTSGEISTSYMASQNAADRIRRYAPQAKIFSIIRNPADLLYSLYWHLVRQNFHCGYTKEISFEDACSRFPESLFLKARMGTHLSYWYRNTPAAQIRTFVYDDIKTVPNRILGEIVSFVSEGRISADRLSLREVKDSRQSALLKPSCARSYRLFYSGLNSFFYTPLKIGIGRQRADWLKEKLHVRQLFTRLFFQKGVPPMADATRKMLNAEFKEEVRICSDLIGRDLSDWIRG
jgi:hypothetical protein